MITRRALLQTAVCACGASLIGQPSWGADDDDDLICSTPQFTEFDRIVPLEQGYVPFSTSPGLEQGYAPFSTSPEGRVVLTPRPEKQTLTMQDFQLFLGSDAWRASDSLPGRPGKIAIGVYFLDGEQAQWDKVREYAPRWTASGGASRVEFVFDNRQKNHIRITFKDANRSRVGRQASLITDEKQATMWLKDVNSSRDEDRQRQVILHEFGHALGLRHEHLHPKSGIKWNKDAVLAYYKKHKWTEADVRLNIFEAYTGTSYLCNGARGYDDTSVMIYPILQGWDWNGYTVMPKSQISTNDLACVQSMYK